jgi:hypothetical protein
VKSILDTGPVARSKPILGYMRRWEIVSLTMNRDQSPSARLPLLRINIDTHVRRSERRTHTETKIYGIARGDVEPEITRTIRKFSDDSLEAERVHFSVESLSLFLFFLKKRNNLLIR